MACPPGGGHWRLGLLKRILVIALAGIGDTLMATPILHELRVQNPGASVEAVVLWGGAREILENNPNVDRVHQHSFIEASKWASLRFVMGLRRPGADLSINVHPQGRREYRLIARLIGARVRLSHEYENHSWLDSLLVTDSVPQDYRVHCVRNNLNLLARAGITAKLGSHAYELYFRPEEKERAAVMAGELGLAGKRWLGIHVGSGGTKNLALRRWPVEYYAEFLRRWKREMPGVPVVLFGGPGEQEAHETLRRAVGEGFIVPETRSLRSAAALLAHAWACLSVDTVFMHLAAAVKVPRQLVIETPTLNPPVCPLRDQWTLIPNPGVGDRHLDYYRYDGRPIAGSPEEIQRLMAMVSEDSVLTACRGAFAG